MSWDETLFGKKPEPPKVSHEPVAPTSWDNLSRSGQQVEDAVDGLIDALDGRSPAVRVCGRCGKPVAGRSNICPDGHQIGG